MLFFSNNKVFAVFILLVSFFNPFAGMAALVSTIVAICAVHALGFSKEQVQTGLYTYSALLLGLGMGTFYEIGTAFWVLLTLASLFSVLLAVVLIAKFARHGLPALSLAFIISFWIVILASKEFSAIGLSERNIYWLNEMYATGGNNLIRYVQFFETLPVPPFVSGFFRSLSAIIFQSNVITGVLLAFALFLNSRIAFVLMAAGYAVAILFNYLMGGLSVSGINYYNFGTNFMLVSVAIGGFYLIPSFRSFFWALVAVPVSYVLVVGLSKITYAWGLPVFSSPFCIMVILFLYCLNLRTKPGKLALTPIQYYSPETNLYRYLNGRDRVNNQYYFRLFLPFLGEWVVSQGYDGNLTHKGDWGKALDFVILDDQMKTFSGAATSPEHFYCYNKPVISPGDGIVEEIVDHVDDNEIGGNNTGQNWGNSIVIKHAEGLFTKLSHLRKNSFKVAKGAYVKKGDIIAACGNSGRSPEPHLHFQVQTTPYVGSKSKSYPVSFYNVREGNRFSFESFRVPKEGQFVSNVVVNTQLQKAFDFQPGLVITVKAENFETEEWEVMTTVYNESYLYSKLHNSYAYFINNGTMFYFTNFFGSKKSLLYQFYLAAYKVLLSSDKSITVNDTFSLTTLGYHPLKWLQDLIAPFYLFMKVNYTSAVKQDTGILQSGSLEFKSKITRTFFSRGTGKMSAVVVLENAEMKSFTIKTQDQTINAVCSA